MEAEEYLEEAGCIGVSEAGRTDSSSSATPLMSSEMGLFRTGRGVALTWSAGS